MINASGPSGVPITSTPTTTPLATPVGTVPTAPITAPISTATPQPYKPAPLATATPATTPVAPATTPAGSGPTGKLKMPAKKLPIKLIIGVGLLILLLIGGLAAYLLSQTSQDVRQQASVQVYNSNYCIANKYNGSAQLYAQEVTVCNTGGGTWSDTSCSCQNAISIGACYTKNSATGECSSRTAAQCEATEAQGQGTYTTIQACRGETTSGTCNPATYYTPNSTGTTGAQCCVGGVTECAANFTCNGPGDSKLGTCQPSSSSTGTGTPTTGTPTANGSGNCAACLGLGGQAERDCYANCSGTIQTGICNGKTAAECQQICSQTPNATTQICTGSQEGAGTPRAGEFLSCGASSTNGCGQVDCIVKSGTTETLVGFVIDTSQCTTQDVGGQTVTPVTTTPTTPTTSSTPTASPVASASPIASPTATPSATVTPSPSPSPSPSPTINPSLASCNQACSKHSDCADLLHSCQGNLCRLTSNPGNSECKEENNTTPPSVPRTDSTPLQCNDPCTSNSQCTTFNHICHEGTCRLSSNLNDVNCRAAVNTSTSTTQLGQISQQPDAPTTLPSAGAEDFATWIMTGIGALAVGAVILLLL